MTNVNFITNSRIWEKCRQVTSRITIVTKRVQDDKAGKVSLLINKNAAKSIVIVRKIKQMIE